MLWGGEAEPVMTASVSPAFQKRCGTPAAKWAVSPGPAKRSGSPATDVADPGRTATVIVSDWRWWTCIGGPRAGVDVLEISRRSPESSRNVIRLPCLSSIVRG